MRDENVDTYRRFVDTYSRNRDPRDRYLFPASC